MTPDDMIFTMTCLPMLAFIALVVAAGYYQTRRSRKIAERLAAVVAQGEAPLLTLNTTALAGEVTLLGGKRTRLRQAILVLTPERCRLFERTPELCETFTFTPDQLRWFGRPRKYSAGYNDIWLHVERDDGWHLLKLRLYQSDMRNLVRALKQVAPPELVEAYRRRRPYVHRGPIEAQPAAQDIHGAWSLAVPVRLYLMPRCLVILDGQTVLRTIPLEAVQQVGALRRLDAPGARGLVRFRAEEETLAFAVDDHEAVAAALAEAAKRTLEAPLERKQKSRLTDDDPEWEDWQTEPEMPPKRLSL